MVIMVFNRMEVYSWIINCLIRTIKMIKYEDQFNYSNYYKNATDNNYDYFCVFIVIHSE